MAAPKPPPNCLLLKLFSKNEDFMPQRHKNPKIVQSLCAAFVPWRLCGNKSILQDKFRQVLPPFQAQFFAQAVTRHFYPPQRDTQQVTDLLGVQIEP